MKLASIPARCHLALALAAAGAFVCGNAVAQQTAAPTREAKAIEVLTAMGKYLRTLKSFTVVAQTTKDEVLDTGQKLQFTSTATYRVRAPDRLQLELLGERVHRRFFYDGKSLTQYAPRPNYYATIPASGTLGELLERASSKYDIELPLADLFFWGTDKAGLDDIKSATLVGATRIDGTVCEHYAYRQDDVDWQLWVRPGARPLPCRLVITTLDDPAQPQYSATLKWNTQPTFGAGTFRFVPPKGAKKIEIVEVKS